MRVAPLAVLLLVLPLFAQRYDDTITVEVVDVPVYVERFGNPITGLTRDDFELFVNGEPHPIDYFDVMAGEVVEEPGGDPAAAENVAASIDLKRRRLTVLVFDVSAPPQSLDRARRAAAAYVDGRAADTTFAVATVSWPGVLFIVPFTNDRIAVQRAIATLRPSAARDPFRVAMLDVERTWDDPGVIGDVRGGGIHGGGFEPPAIAGRFVNATLDLAADQNDFSSRGLIDNLMDLADRLAALEGLKEVVLLSEGHEDRAAGYTWAGRLASIVRLHKRFRAAGVVLNAVDISTPRAPGGSAVSRGTAGGGMPNLTTSAFLWSLALDTGGIATTSMSQLQRRQGAGYVLGFRPPPGKRSSSIHVNVRNVGFLTDVRYRKSYTLERETKDDGLFLADTILNDIPQSGLTLDVSVNGKWIAASVPGVELLALNEHRVKLDVYFYVFGEDDRPVAWNRLQIAVDIEKGREFLSANPYTMRQEFVLEPGRYVAKALVRIVGTDRIGFQRVPFEVEQ